jgi:cellulose 1,4-beta-cellobiosidase
MSKPRGGLIVGAVPTWTTTATSGVFTLREAQEMRTSAQWPRGPVAPTSLTATAGNAQLSLSWTAPATTHGTITNYLVEYTPSGGSAAYVLTGSTSTSYSLTGLTNGTSYSVRVAAVNFTAGDYSTTATGTPADALAAPTLTRVSCNGDGLVAFSWTSVPNATTYRLQTNANSNSGAGTYADVQATGSTAWSGDVGGQAFGQGWFRVRAEVGAQVSPYSNLVQANCGSA